MTEHSLSLIRSGTRQTAPVQGEAQGQIQGQIQGKRNHSLDRIDSERIARKLAVFQAAEHLTEDCVDNLLLHAELRMGSLASKCVIRQIMEINPDCIWGVARKSAFDPSRPSADGFVALLLLTREGMRALAAGTLDCSNPDLRMIAKKGQRPAGIYFWATFAPGVLAASVPLVIKTLSTGPYEGVPLYTRATTEDGRRFAETLGAVEGAVVDGIVAPHLFIYERAARPKSASRAPLYDSHRPGNEPGVLSVSVTHTVEDWMRVSAIRAAVYIGEQRCPYEEEYDGNDFAALHLIGWAGDEPVGCIRIRHFADFAKVERLAVRREFRNTRMSFLLVKAAIELCRVKGYRRIYGHAQRRLLDFWKRFGAVPFEGGKEFVFSDFDYVEVMVEIEPHPNAIRIGTDPFVIIRPEGCWHKPGVLERSSKRPVTRPSVGFAK